MSLPSSLGLRCAGTAAVKSVEMCRRRAWAARRSHAEENLPPGGVTDDEAVATAVTMVHAGQSKAKPVRDVRTGSWQGQR
jgi:hypothetical protein